MDSLPTQQQKSKENYHLKRRTRSPKEEGQEEHTPNLPEEEYHSSSSDGSPSPCKKKKRMITFKENFERSKC